MIFTVRLKLKGDDVEEGRRGHGRRDGLRRIVRSPSGKRRDKEEKEEDTK
jgi:hypothetical protein